MISLRDISTICGLSVSTVSRALHDYSDISVETKQYVQSVAERIGYSKEENQSKKAGERTRKSKCIGLIYRGIKKDEAVLNMDIQVLHSVREKAVEKGCDLMLVRGGEDGRRGMSWLACARFHALDGVIILGSTMEMYDPQIMELLNSGIPAVIVGQSYDERSCINVDFASGMDFLMQEVYRCGYRRTAFICPKSGRSSSVRRAVYLRNVLRTDSVGRPEYLIMTDRCSREEIQFYTKRLVYSRVSPECIMYPDDISAMWGIAALREEGIRVPEDIGVTGFGGVPQLFGTMSALTTWSIDCLKIGSTASSVLFEQIEHPDLFLPQTQLVSGRMLPGMTLRYTQTERAVSG